MIINGSSGTDPYQKVALETTETTKRSSLNSTGSQEAQSVAPKTDKVSFSDDAKLRTMTYSEAMSSPDARSEKVADLKQQVQSGTYSADSMKTAEAMLSDIFADKSMYV